MILHLPGMSLVHDRRCSPVITGILAGAEPPSPVASQVSLADCHGEWLGSLGMEISRALEAVWSASSWWVGQPLGGGRALVRKVS